MECAPTLSPFTTAHVRMAGRELIVKQVSMGVQAEFHSFIRCEIFTLNDTISLAKMLSASDFLKNGQETLKYNVQGCCSNIWNPFY